MGNCLAQQYGGSDAHTKFFKDQRGQWSARTQVGRPALPSYKG